MWDIETTLTAVKKRVVEWWAATSLVGFLTMVTPAEVGPLDEIDAGSWIVKRL